LWQFIDWEFSWKLHSSCPYNGEEVWDRKTLKQKEGMRKGQVSSPIEEVYDRGRHIGGMRKFRKCERVGWRVWEGVWGRGQRN